ncbi:MAG: DUF1566 domain-containing protein [Ilumatobacteraceae bacterium]|nr:DUF1566 domain-containing protein [Ilumatobacteraceae bacterium]
MSKTLTRTVLFVLTLTLACAQTASASGVTPTISNICINRTTGVLRSLRTSPIKACDISEVKVRANKVCVNKLSGKLRHLATNVKQICRSGEVKLVWNQSISAFVTTVNNTSTSPLATPLRSTTSTGTATSANVAAAPIRTFSYKLGDVGPGGGLIFFVDTLSQFDGFTYLEAAPVDLPKAAWANTSVGCFGSSNVATSCLDASIYQESQADLSRINAAKIGQGSINTALIKTRISSGVPIDNMGFAAGMADAYVYGSTTDWFLPSINELGLMNTNLRAKGLGNFQDSYYWSSTEFGTDSAWYVLFGPGYFSNTEKSSAFLTVRPIRSFG